MGWKYYVGKITSALLIGFSVYQIIYSTFLLILVYPNLNLSRGPSGALLYESLVEKALVYYASMIINGIYGMSLLFKKKEELTYLQIVGGLIIFALGLFFITKTELTSDPATDLFFNLLESLRR